MIGLCGFGNALTRGELFDICRCRRGDGADYSAFAIFKTSTMEMVSEYRGKITPDVFSRILFDAASEYNTAPLVVENNSVGFTVLDKLIEMIIKIYTILSSLRTNMLSSIWENSSRMLYWFYDVI